MRRIPPLLAAASEAEQARRVALVTHLETAEPSPSAVSLAQLVPDAVWPWEIRNLALVIDFDRKERERERTV